ncbi:MAG: FtsQ-type POTRA domain-containing protein [Burkholderiaceae bacterium]|nr:FtsQ-type POTRA domain-containing protein [Burkholderiaceae bacterium]
MRKPEPMPTASVRWMDVAARLLFGLALLTIAGTAVAWVAQRPSFDFKRIEVYGSAGELKHVSTAAVRSAVAGRLAGGFFTMRLDDARRAFETVPWVAGASVRRVWPDRLIVTLTEHRALGVWGDGRVLSDEGRLFVANAAEAEIYGPLVEFDGPPQFAPEAARRFYEFASALAALSMQIDTVDVSERASWRVHTRSGQTIELGRDEPPGQIAARLQLINASYPLMLTKFGAAPSRIDARYPNGLAAATPAGMKLAPATAKKP